MNEWVLITTCKQLVWYSRIGRNIPIWILCLRIRSPVWFFRRRWRGVWWGSCSKQESWVTLGRDVYYLPYYLLSCLSLPSGLSFCLLYLSGLGRVPMMGMRGVVTKGIGWASDEAPDLVVSPLSLVLYMHLRIFAYTSNTLIASFENMDCMLASGTLMALRSARCIFLSS
jgi:hypothetical protein